MNHQGLSYVPKIIRTELTSGPLWYWQNSKTRCQKILLGFGRRSDATTKATSRCDVCLSAVATNTYPLLKDLPIYFAYTYPLLEVHQLRFDPRHRWLTYENNAPRLLKASSEDSPLPSALKSIGLQRWYTTSQADNGWYTRTGGRLHAFKLNCVDHPRVFYEHIK